MATVVAPVKSCATCGASMPYDAIWCVACKLYQLDNAVPARTARCEHCGIWLLSGARICYSCKEPVQKSWRTAWSVAALSAVTALAASFVALLLTLGQVLTHHFPTPAKLIVRLVDPDLIETQLVVALLNEGDTTAVIDGFPMDIVVTQKLPEKTSWTLSEPLTKPTEVAFL